MAQPLDGRPLVEQHEREQLVAVANVVVHRGLGHPSPASNSDHRDAGNAVFADQLGRGLEDPRARALHGVAGSDLRSASSRRHRQLSCCGIDLRPRLGHRKRCASRRPQGEGRSRKAHDRRRRG